jgi:xylanolytic transcriptional activator XlnR
MAILGDIIYLHHRRNHPRFSVLDESNEVTAILEMLHIYGASLVKMASDNNLRRSNTLEAYAVGIDDFPSPLSRSRETLSTNPYSGAVTRTQLVIAYSTHILHVLYVLLHGKWDVICMLDSEDDWITSRKFTESSSHAISASHALFEILELDPDLTFMPYLFGIYLLHGSFILLLFADRMPQLGANDSVVEACETIIRAHEICVVTLSTEFQVSSITDELEFCA